MAITSGTKYRARYKRPGDTTWKNFTNETTLTVNETTNTRQINHKDNPGDHDEHIVDGFGGNAALTCFHEDQGTLTDVRAARLLGETITMQYTDGVTGHEVHEQPCIFTNVTVNSATRESVTFQINMLFIGEPTYTTISA